MTSKKLPKGWSTCLLEDLITRMSNGANVQQYDEKFGYPITRIETIWNENIDLTRIKFIKEDDPDFVEKYRLESGDILFSHINSDSHLGKTAVFKNQTNTLIHGINLLLIRPSKNILSEFLNYQFKFLRNSGAFIDIAQRAVNQSSINQKKLKSLIFLLPPLNEQKRIVAQIEKLFSELDNGRENLVKAQELLKIYRQLLLKNAFEGNLTKKWRKTVDCKLINANLASLKNNFKNLPPPPPNWVWVTLDAIGDLICGQSPSISQVNYEGKGYLYVTGPEQWNGKEIKQTKWTEFPTRIAPINSIFITVKGAGVGKLFPGTDCVIGRDIYAFCPFKSMNHKFVFYSLLYGINKVILKAKGDIPGLSKSHILDHTIGLPPLEEQNLIVEILESKFLSIEEIENELKDRTDQIRLLRQSILKKAFSGELVHQNPNDEPAYAFLERIKSEQLNHSTPQTKSKKKQKVSV